MYSAPFNLKKNNIRGGPIVAALARTMSAGVLIIISALPALPQQYKGYTLSPTCGFQTMRL